MICHNRSYYYLGYSASMSIPDSSIRITSESASQTSPKQAVTLPPRFCDSRVKVMQADAREVSPMVFQVGDPWSRWEINPATAVSGREVHGLKGAAAVIIVCREAGQ